MSNGFEGLGGTLGDQEGDFPMYTGQPAKGWWNQIGLGGTLGDQEGDFPMPTNPQTPGAFGNPFNQLTQFLKNSNLAQAIPLFGLSALARNSSYFNPPPPKVGFQGTIPQYTYERQQTPLDQQRPEDYRPGQGGITYFTPGTFTKGAAPTTQPGTTGGITTGTGGKSQLPNVPTGAAILSALRNFANSGIGSIATVPRDLPVADPSKPAIVSSKAPLGYDYRAAPINTEREQQINALYRSILNRDAETEGLKHWRDSGLSLPEIEKQIRQIAGDIGVPVSIPQNLPVTNPDRPTIISSKAGADYDYSAAPISTEREKQINDIYRRVLNREAELEGLKHWRDSGLSVPEIEKQIRKIAGEIGVAVTKPPVVDPNFDIMDYASGGYMPGGIAMLAKGRYLKGNGDGVSDSIPARFAGSGQEARLADGEFVIPARVVSELGNGSSDAGARKLYAMLDRVEARAKKAKRGKPSGADRELNKLA
jgi:hypothetical protein